MIRRTAKILTKPSYCEITSYNAILSATILLSWLHYEISFTSECHFHSFTKYIFMYIFLNIYFLREYVLEQSFLNFTVIFKSTYLLKYKLNKWIMNIFLNSWYHSYQKGKTKFTFPSASCWISHIFLHWLPCHFFVCYRRTTKSCSCDIINSYVIVSEIIVHFELQQNIV